MKYIIAIFYVAFISMIYSCRKPSCSLDYENPDSRIIFLHHSTGNNVWYGDIEQKKGFTGKNLLCMVPRLLKEYNDKNGKKISIEERNFPSGNPYPWENYPYDYYNIWVKNGGESSYLEEPTLETLTKSYDLIVFKHCFPVSNILADDGNPSIISSKKTIANYKLQYEALRNKLKEFPNTKFLVWTGAALVESQTNADEAKRADEFAKWVKNEWDLSNDNIFIFDFRNIETEGGLFLKPEYSVNQYNSHPNMKISEIAARLFVERMIEVL